MKMKQPTREKCVVPPEENKPASLMHLASTHTTESFQTSVNSQFVPRTYGTNKIDTRLNSELSSENPMDLVVQMVRERCAAPPMKRNPSPLHSTASTGGFRPPVPQIVPGHPGINNSDTRLSNDLSKRVPMDLDVGLPRKLGGFPPAKGNLTPMHLTTPSPNTESFRFGASDRPRYEHDQHKSQQ